MILVYLHQRTHATPLTQTFMSRCTFTAELMICFTLLFDTYNRSFSHGGHEPRAGPRAPAELHEGRRCEARVRYGVALFCARRVAHYVAPGAARRGRR